MLQKTEKQFIQLHKEKSEKRIASRKMLGTLAFVVFAIVSNAQFQYGVKINSGASCQSDMLEIANNCDVRFSPGFGLVGKYRFTDGFALKSGLEYTQKGRSLDNNDISLSNKLQYLNLPIKAEFSASEKAGFRNGQRVFFAAGPYLSYLLAADGDLNDVAFDLKSDTKDFDFGLSMEMGIEFPVFTNKTLQFGLNYDMGFVEVYKSEPDLHNKMASISVGLMF
ncbi:porin family protein [Prolixibacteraceae bacterium Z1-6]|uniref:Porin family protein n=1 Tax=Draconibacterium aestuarii TaxID=2998507 RepID=A0A9X3J793_9BACT|nr:porin family protein [Prolixibacteraceae bacterium Z1-6]